jgi:hypothetical protein
MRIVLQAVVERSVAKTELTEHEILVQPCVKSSGCRLFAPSGDEAFCQAQSIIAICLPSPVRMTLELTLESCVDNLGTSIFNKPKSLSLAS